MKKPAEDELHKGVVTALRYQRPKCIWWHTPNQGDLPVQYRVKLQSMGLRPGVADLVFIGASEVPVGFIELKTETGRLNDNQKDFKADCEARGIPYVVIKSSDLNEMNAAVVGTLKAWGAL
jgi:hypothetical protein